jgi:hypothetical protein
MVQRHEPTPGRIHQCRGLGFRGEGGEGGFWRRNGVRAGAVGGGGRGTVTVSGSWGSVLQLRLGFRGFLTIDHRWGCEEGYEGTISGWCCSGGATSAASVRQAGVRGGGLPMKEDEGRWRPEENQRRMEGRGRTTTWGRRRARGWRWGRGRVINRPRDRLRDRVPYKTIVETSAPAWYYYLDIWV